MNSNGGIVSSLLSTSRLQEPSAVIGLVITVVLLLKKSSWGYLVGIVLTTLFSDSNGGCRFIKSKFWKCFWFNNDLGTTFMAALVQKESQLFSDPARLLLVLPTIFAFMASIHLTLRTFIGTGRKQESSWRRRTSTWNGSGFSSKMDKKPISRCHRYFLSGQFSVLQTTTYVESAAGIGAGGRTG